MPYVELSLVCISMTVYWHTSFRINAISVKMNVTRRSCIQVSRLSRKNKFQLIDHIIFGKRKNSKRNIIFQGIRLEMTRKFASNCSIQEYELKSAKKKIVFRRLVCLIITMFLRVMARPIHFQIQILVLAQTGHRSQKRHGEGPWRIFQPHYRLLSMRCLPDL